MTYKASLLLLVVVLTCLAGCGSKDSGGGGGSGGGAPTGPAVCGLSSNADGSLLLEAAEANDYSFVSTLTLNEAAVKPRSELSFDWSAVMRDFSKHTVDPLADIDMVSLIVWKLTPAELATKLNEDTLQQRDFEAISMVYTNNARSSAKLFEFTEFMQPIDQATLLGYLDPTKIDQSTHAYTVMAMTGTTPGKGTRMIESFRLDDTSTNTQIALSSDSASLQFQVDLKSLQPVQVPTGRGDITIDWSQIKKNSHGADFDPTYITQVLVGKYSQSVAELQDRFLDLDMIADQLYQGAVSSGSSFHLSSTMTKTGVPFTGIDDSGTWLVALECGTCTNPAPWFITVLQPCGTAAATPDAGP